MHQEEKEVGPGIASAGYFSEVASSGGTRLFFWTPAHSRLNTEHRSDDLNETVALSCNRSVFVSCKKCFIVRELLASQPPLNPWKDDGAPHSGGHLRPHG